MLSFLIEQEFTIAKRGKNVNGLVNCVSGQTMIKNNSCKIECNWKWKHVKWNKSKIRSEKRQLIRWTWMSFFITCRRQKKKGINNQMNILLSFSIFMIIVFITINLNNCNLSWLMLQTLYTINHKLNHLLWSKMRDKTM